MNPPLISLCMIVKDEEAVLGKCLDSVKDWVDEIIIVDTGSTDSTKSIARKYTDKVFDFQWINDFSAARNEALKHATGTWILVLDADEYLEEKEIRKLREIVSSKKPEANIVYNLTVLSFLGSKFENATNAAPVVRVFANHQGIRYIRPIHEQPVNMNGLEMTHEHLPVRILHTGYSEETIKDKNKHERNLSLFKELEKKRGLTAYDHLMLGNQYLMMREYDQALHHLHLAKKHPKSLSNAYRQVLFSILQAYINTGKLIEAYLFFEENLQPYAHYPDMLTIKGILLNNLGFTEMAKQAFLKALEEADRRAAAGEEIAIVSMDVAVRLALWQLVSLHEQEKDFPQAIAYLAKLLVMDPKDAQALALLVELLSLKDGAPAIIRLLNKLVHPEKDRLLSALLFKIAVQIGQRELAEYYSRLFDFREAMELGDLLRYYLLVQQPLEFEQVWKDASQEARARSSAIQAFIAGVFVWNRPEWLDQLKLDEAHEAKSYLDWAKSLFSGKADPNSHPKYAAELMRTFYVCGQTNIYDEWIDQITSPEIINDLANYYYTKHQIELADQYYAHLIQNNAISGESWIHLASIYIRQGALEDAAFLLENAIQAYPHRYKLYIQYCLIAPDAKRKEMLRRLYEKEPRYKQLSLLHT